MNDRIGFGLYQFYGNRGSDGRVPVCCQRTEQVPIELDISAIEDYILLLLLVAVV